MFCRPRKTASPQVLTSLIPGFMPSLGNTYAHFACIGMPLLEWRLDCRPFGIGVVFGYGNADLVALFDFVVGDARR